MPTRNYAELEKRLHAQKQPDLEQAVIGTVHNYPIYRLLLGDPDKPTVMITGGMHGDEPAGVETVFRFLERDLSPVLAHFRFFIIPCINPSGYVNNTRENADGHDINRGFEEDALTEVVAIKKALEGFRFVFHLDMHEDYDATGSYFYEGRKDDHWFVPSIAQRARAIGPLDTHQEDGQTDRPLADGVYQVDPDWGLAGLICYTLAFHTDHVIMPETASTQWELDRRVAVHLLALDTLLTHYAT